MGMDDLIQTLKATRTSLLRAYFLHVVWFTVMCLLAAVQWSQHGLRWSVLLTLLTVPPVLIYTVRIHNICRAIDPSVRTVGWVPVLITTFVLSPFESGLVLPIKNLLWANRLLAGHASGLTDRSSRSSIASRLSSN